jgi:hypothetical protein
MNSAMRLLGVALAGVSCGIIYAAKYSSGVDLEETADLLAYAALASLILSQVIGAKPKAEE